jgi:hypothetical protein
MANSRKGNLIYIDTASSQVDFADPNIRVLGVVLARNGAGAHIHLNLADYHASSPTVLMRLEMDTNTHHLYVDFSNSPLVFPNGLSIPASGLTTGAKATIIVSKNEVRK